MKNIIYCIFIFGIIVLASSCSDLDPDNNDLPENPKKLPLLVLAQHPGDMTTMPASIAENIAHIESLPFDGIFIKSDAGWLAMGGKALNWVDVSSEFAPLKGAFKKLKNNFLMIFVDFPGDLWEAEEAWKITAKNFALMARIAKELGCKGIVYDNEEYKTRWHSYNYNYNNTNNPAYNRKEHASQTTLRGKQVMEAMVEVFPEIEVLVYHGPYLSEPRTPSAFSLNQMPDWLYHELLGPFFVGLVQGCGEKSNVIDGGELYQYRTKEHFEVSYQWRKYDIASEETKSWMIPQETRSKWSNNVQIAFAVYHHQSSSRFPMNPEIMEPTLINAMQSTDKYVWYYTEVDNWLIPGKMPEEWRQAVVNARDSIKNLPVRVKQ